MGLRAIYLRQRPDSRSGISLENKKNLTFEVKIYSDMIKVEQLSKAKLVEYCTDKEIDATGMSKKELIDKVTLIEKKEILNEIKTGKGLESLINRIKALADKYSFELSNKIKVRKAEMKLDNNSHYLIYRVLGIATEEGRLIDEYQNTGRFLYKYAGSFLEEAASLCLKFKNVDGGKVYVENNIGQRPKNFEIDFLDEKNAIEIKWRDATTDGDHITKEHTRVRSIEKHGYTPIRVMFYYPEREQAKRIQETLKTIYNGVNGQYYGGEDAWDFICKYSGYDLKAILTSIANERFPKDEAK
ncbi:MAG: ApaLI family restriction endonuclease [Bacteroidales bacterium]